MISCSFRNTNIKNIALAFILVSIKTYTQKTIQAKMYSFKIHLSQSIKFN